MIIVFIGLGVWTFLVPIMPTHMTWAAFAIGGGLIIFVGYFVLDECIESELPEQVEEVEEILCPNCGEELEDDAIFCPKCGTQIEEEEER
jgi:DNA-directed RNA polymerase subunit RPC12/RpoP